jgi:hypothetical protein
VRQNRDAPDCLAGEYASEQMRFTNERIRDDRSARAGCSQDVRREWRAMVG